MSICESLAWWSAGSANSLVAIEKLTAELLCNGTSITRVLNLFAGMGTRTSFGRMDLL